MQLKDSPEGYLIYVGMIAVAVGLVFHLLRKGKLAAVAGVAACAAVLAAWGLRWHNVGHIPMQNMYEVFLTLGVLMLPMGLAARYLTGIHNQWDKLGDYLLMLVLLFPAGFIFTDLPQKLPPALQSPLFGPHVAVYMLSYVLLAKAAIQACMGLVQTNDKLELSKGYEQSAYLLVCLGFPFLSLGLFLGSFWGKLAWGDWWGWDPKELWSLACWMMVVFYFHWRYIYGQKRPRINCIWVILGLVFIVITLLWVNLSRIFAGMHNYAS
jgi:ABC-type transport system involved in cytochrome c biogenesis permease subunit